MRLAPNTEHQNDAGYLEGLVENLVQRTRKPCEAALKDAGISPSEIDEVVLVGGQTRMPKIREFVKSVFGKEPNMSVNPDEVVAMGAAIQAGVARRCDRCFAA